MNAISQLSLEYIVTFAPVILAGAMNMLWVKVGWSKLRYPLDHNLVLKDGERLFGENKTYLGLVGYVLWNIVFTILWGWVNAQVSSLENLNLFYRLHENTYFYNVGVGFLLGVAYTIFELPNSFLKRRVKIRPGKSIQGPRRLLFTILDQIDSILGVGLVLRLFYPLSLWQYMYLLFLGFFVHALANVLLYLFGLRENPL